MLTADRNTINAWWPALAVAIDAHEAYCIVQVNDPAPDPTAEALYAAAFNVLGTSVVSWLEKDRDYAINDLFMGLYGAWSLASTLPNIAPPITDSNYTPLKVFDPAGVLTTIESEASTGYYTTNSDTDAIGAKVTLIDNQTAVDDEAATRGLVSGINNQTFFVVSMAEDALNAQAADTKAEIRDRFYGSAGGELGWKAFNVASGRYDLGLYSYPLDVGHPLYGQF